MDKTWSPLPLQHHHFPSLSNDLTILNILLTVIY